QTCALPIYSFMDSPSLSYYHQIRRLCLMTNHKNGKRYSDDFRKMVVDLYNSGQSVRDLSREYVVSDVTIYAWIKKLSPMELEDGSSVTQEDYAELKKQILKLKQENEILKKATAIFAKK